MDKDIVDAQSELSNVQADMEVPCRRTVSEKKEAYKHLVAVICGLFEKIQSIQDFGLVGLAFSIPTSLAISELCIVCGECNLIISAFMRRLGLIMRRLIVTMRTTY